MVWWLCFVVIYGPIGFPDNWRPFPFCNLSCTILNLLCSMKIFDNIWNYLKYLHANYLALSLREDIPKRSSCSFGFCPNEGGEGPAQTFCPLFTNCIYWVNLGKGREGETPAQIFWHISVKKKWYKLPKLGGLGGGRGNLDKIQMNSYFFLGVRP